MTKKYEKPISEVSELYPRTGLCEDSCRDGQTEDYNEDSEFNFFG